MPPMIYRRRNVLRIRLTKEQLREFIEDDPDSILAHMCKDAMNSDPHVFALASVLAPIMAAILLIWVWVMVPMWVRASVRAFWISYCVGWAINYMRDARSTHTLQPSV